MTPRRRLVLACLALWLLTFGLYASSIGFDFVDFDDLRILLGHPNLYNEDSLLASLEQIVVSYFPREEPLLVRDISWAIDARLFGLHNPFGFHLGNVVLNACNAVLLLLLLVRLTRRFGFALIVASLFAVHPLHVEPVCWVMGRKDLLATFFMLGTLYLQAGALENPDAQVRRRLYLLTIVGTGLAILSKFNAVVFVLVLALHRLGHPFLDGRRAPDASIPWPGVGRRVFLSLLPHVVVSVLLYVWYNQNLTEYGILTTRHTGPFDLYHLKTLAVFSPLVLAQYIRLLVVPADYSVFYAWPSVTVALQPAEWVEAGLVLVLLAVVLVHLARRRRDLLCYLLWFLALMIPYLNLVYIGIWLANRYVYLSLFCLLALLVSPLLEWVGRRARPVRRVAQGATVVVLVLLAVVTLVHQQVWRDNRSLWLHEVSVARPSMLSFEALAKSYMKQARTAEPDEQRQLLQQAEEVIARGIAHFDTLDRVTRGPYYTYEFGYLSKLHCLRGQNAEIAGEPLEVQLAHYLKAYEISPVNPLNSMVLASTYQRLALRSAGAEREQYARESLRHFRDHVAQIRQDQIRLAKSALLCDALYGQRFPFLDAELDELKERYYP